MQSTENWRPVPGYEGYYEVSDIGNVRSVDRMVPIVEPRRQYLRRRRGAPMATRVGTNGYVYVAFCKDGVHRNCTVHSLVARAFLGAREDGAEVCHVNGVRADNRLSNLRWGTHQENIDDRDRHGTTARGEKLWTAKLTADKVREIRKLYAGGNVDQGELAKRFGVNRQNISMIVTRSTWKHVD